MNKTFEAFLLQLAKVLHFSTLTSDEQGACLIKMKESGQILLFEFDDLLVPHTILLSSQINEFPIQLRAAIYEAILIANGMIEETLSIKPDCDLLYLHRRFHPDLPADELAHSVADFIETAQQWRKNIEIIAMKERQYEQNFPKTSSIQIFPYKV